MRVNNNFKFKISSLKLNKGFSLIEIIILLGIVSILISVIIPLFLDVITINKRAEYYSTAYKKLDSKIEEYRSSSFDSLTSSTFAVPELPNGQGSLMVTNDIDGSNQNDIKKIDLTLSWNFKRPQSIRSVTYIARSGIRK